MSTTKKAHVYILLTRTGSIVSRAIAAATNNQYTHASLSLDYNLTRLYSFGRLYDYIPWIGCFKREETSSGVFGRFRSSPCALFELEVSESAYEEITARINEMAHYRDQYKFNIIGLFSNYFGMSFYRENHYFCSEFVADTLMRSNALKIDRPPSLVRPIDFTGMGGLREIYHGTISGLDDFIHF